jgi:hypothetical protein
MVLKEQIRELKGQIDFLHVESQYAPLRRFLNPLFPRRFEPQEIRRELRNDAGRYRQMIGVLDKGGPPVRRMLEVWADAYAL